MRALRSLRPPLSVTVAAVAAALVLASCGSAGPAEDTAPSTTSSTPAEDPTGGGAPAGAAPTGEADEAAGKTLEVTVEGDTISPNGAEMSLSAGDELVLEITSDREGELHVHARPEAHVPYGPGRSTERVVLENPGAVEIEDHDTGFVVALVQVR